jgi:hypothetical protein
MIEMALLGALLALSPEAREFMDITAQLETVQCEKRRLRREITLTEVEKKDSTALRKRFAALDRDPKTAKLEKRLAELQPRLARSRDAEDLPAIDRQRVQAFYRCE